MTNTALTDSLSYLEPDCWSVSSSNCCFLTCIQISQEAGQVVWYAHLFQNFPQFIVIHTVEGFGIINKAEIDVFLKLSCFFDDPADVGNLISGSSAFSKSSLNIWKFMVHVLLKPGLENFKHYFTSVWDECSCVVVCAFSVLLSEASPHTGELPSHPEHHCSDPCPPCTVPFPGLHWTSPVNTGICSTQSPFPMLASTLSLHSLSKIP